MHLIQLKILLLFRSFLSYIYPKYVGLKILFRSLPLLMFFFSGCKNKQSTPTSIYIQELNQGLLDAVVQDGFSPPVASRVYAYPNIAAYEAVIEGDSAFISYAGQLKGLNELPQPDKTKPYICEAVMVQAFSDVAKFLVYRDYIIDQKYDALIKQIKESEANEEEVNSSLEFGKKLGAAIIDWAKKDNYSQTRNFSKFTVTNTDSCWLPTPPKYMEALEPHWAKVRAFVLDSTSQFREPLPYQYNSNTTSEFYGIAKQMCDMTNNLDEDKHQFIKFWDDNPSPINISGHVVTTNRQNTPGGHWLCITRSIAKDKKLSLAETCEIISKVSIAIADAFKVIWDTKYVANNVRPITFINKYINPNWSPILETPNFPEFTSGHSGISAAAAYILTQRFGDNYSFTDSCNVPFGFQPRKFPSFNAAANEAAISRVYGGIHYNISCKAGAEQGVKVGELVVWVLKTRK